MSVRHNINIIAGELIQRTVQYLDENDAAINLTGYTAAMHLKRNLDDAAATVEATTANGRIVITGATGTVAVTIPVSVTEDLSGEYLYDLFIYNAGDTERVCLLRGNITVEDRVTV
jgi:hypothetical protein